MIPVCSVTRRRSSATHASETNASAPTPPSAQSRRRSVHHGAWRRMPMSSALRRCRRHRCRNRGVARAKLFLFSAHNASGGNILTFNNTGGVGNAALTTVQGKVIINPDVVVSGTNFTIGQAAKNQGTALVTINGNIIVAVGETHTISLSGVSTGSGTAVAIAWLRHACHARRRASRAGRSRLFQSFAGRVRHRATRHHQQRLARSRGFQKAALKVIVDPAWIILHDRAVFADSTFTVFHRFSKRPGGKHCAAGEK